MSEYAVTAIGRDRPGIVAALSGLLLDLGGNIEDSRMSILGGHFAVMLIVDLPAGVAAASLGDGLEAVRRDLGLEAVSLNEVASIGREDAGASHVLTVYGADRPGIVHSVTAVLAEHGVNVTDLSTRVTGGESPVYVMLIELGLGEVPEDDLRDAVGAAAEKLEVDVSLRRIEAEAL